MRTTLTLDEDVAAKLHAEMRRSGKSFKETLNEFLRIGLQTTRATRSSSRFKVEPKPLGTLPGLNYDCTSQLLEEGGPFHK
jgi:hypothetical protein